MMLISLMSKRKLLQRRNSKSMSRWYWEIYLGNIQGHIEFWNLLKSACLDLKSNTIALYYLKKVLLKLLSISKRWSINSEG